MTIVESPHYSNDINIFKKNQAERGSKTLKDLNFRTNKLFCEGFLSTGLIYSCAMAHEGPSLMKLSCLFFFFPGCEWRSSCCCVPFTPALLCVPPWNCVKVTSSHFVFICVCENGLILVNVEQPQLRMYIWRVDLCSRICTLCVSDVWGLLLQKP